MTIQIENEYGGPITIDYETIIRKVVEGALEHEGCPYETEVSVILTSDEEIRVMNRAHRGIDRATDVLSFPMADYAQPADFSQFDTEDYDDCFNPETGELMLGDIVISMDKVYAQASLYGHSPVRELGFLTAHSMLHLMGYDHMEEQEREVMEQRQRDILDILDIKR